MAPLNVAHAISLLSRTPAALDALLRDQPEALTHTNEGGTTWNAYDIVGHLVHTERGNWLPRVRRILEFGESRAFDPLDRLAQVRESQGKSLAQLLDEFTQLRRANVRELGALHLEPHQLAARGTHPRLGSVTLSELLATWAAHDLTHLHQLSRVMAHQYRETVGPFGIFLGVLQCDGHSASA